MNDTELQAVADHGEPRSDTAIDESKYVLSVDDAIACYKAAGIPRIRRTVQKYCSNGTLNAHRFAIPYGEKYLITPESLDRHIQYVLEARSAMADHGEPRLDTPAVASLEVSESGSQHTNDVQEATVADHGEPRSAAASAETSAAVTQPEIVEMLKGENKFLKEQIAVKDAQLSVKDRQIADQSERTRETNLLVASLHKLITPLLGRWKNTEPPSGVSDSAGSNLGDEDIHQQDTMTV